MSKFKHCGRGVCAAEAGHKGTCAQASGWDEFTADVADRAYESGLADGRAEAVAEEPEWEYGISSGHGSVNYVGTRESVDARVRSFEKAGAPLRDGEQIVRRRKVGLWVPVKREGAETDA